MVHGASLACATLINEIYAHRRVVRSMPADACDFPPAGVLALVARMILTYGEGRATSAWRLAPAILQLLLTESLLRSPLSMRRRLQ